MYIFELYSKKLKQFIILYFNQFCRNVVPDVLCNIYVLSTSYQIEGSSKFKAIAT